MNECIPKYEPGQDLTGHVAQAGGVVGKRFLAISADKQGVEAVSDDISGGNIVVSYPAAGARTVGVSGYDASQGRKVKLVRGPGKVVPITAGAALAVDQEVEADAQGRAVPFGTAVGGRARGRTIRSAANATDALVELY
jgi:hypothetical protein